MSYGCTFVTQRDSRIGVMMIGYADGLRRAPATQKEVLVRGKRAPIVGRVCMDQTMIDVTDIPEAKAGDEVVLIGIQGPEGISAEKVGEETGTNNYEVVATISARVPRLYKKGGRLVQREGAKDTIPNILAKILVVVRQVGVVRPDAVVLFGNLELVADRCDEPLSAASRAASRTSRSRVWQSSSNIG